MQEEKEILKKLIRIYAIKHREAENNHLQKAYSDIIKALTRVIFDIRQEQKSNPCLGIEVNTNLDYSNRQKSN